MNLDQIATKCFILALFIRDDGERLLLGDGYYDFNQKLQHFQANIIANDVVEIQGDNGQLLAGQVMRSGAQKFEGYIGDATTNRQTIEQKRSDFMAFFRIKHFYKVIYIFPDGTAIQRQRGYLTDAPTIPEIFQKFPEYSVALNFEDANYYEYAEDEHGDEIYAHIAELALAGGATGGLVWDAIGAVTNGITWSGIQTAQGEYIQITNELDIPAKLASVEMLGKAEQTTYSGKNLCYYGYYESTATARFDINKSTLQQTFTISYISDVTAGNATIYLFTDGTNRGSVGVTIQQTAGVKHSATVTLNATNWGYIQNATDVRFTAYLGNAGHTNGTIVTQAMVENGSAMTDYEPYVGGTASPSPKYPQPISVVTGENVVKIEGKNLFDKSTATQDYRLGSTGSPFADSDYYLSDYISVRPDTAYYISGTSGAPASSAICFYASDKSFISRRAFVNDWYTFTTPANTAFLRFTTLKTNSIDQVQLELGSTATAYEPYQGQECKVNLGKNLFELTANTRTDAGVVFTKTTDTITASGTTTRGSNAETCSIYDNFSGLGNYPAYATISATNSFQLPAGTYTFSASITNNGNTTGGLNIGVGELGARVSTTTKLEKTAGTSGQASATVSVTEGQYVLLTIWYEGTSTNKDVNISATNIQLEKGSSASSFAPYFTPIELAKIGDYQDRIYKSADKWYVHKEVGKVVLDGTETWTLNESGTGYVRFTTVQSGLITSFSNSQIYTMSDKFVASTQTETVNANADANRVCVVSNGRLLFKTLDTTLNTTAKWQTWLGTNNTTVYYALATPTTIEITNEALIAQLDALGASSLYIGVNNIGTETQNAMPTLKIEYYTEYKLEGAGYEWEPGGNTAKTIVTVAGVDSAWPIWTVQGGAQNPTLTNITTGQTISWQGFVPEGQTLTINMAEMTADLAGANVFEYITGEWLRLAPGNNTLVYNAGNADKPSTLSWNGVLA